VDDQRPSDSVISDRLSANRYRAGGPDLARLEEAARLAVGIGIRVLGRRFGAGPRWVRFDMADGGCGGGRKQRREYDGGSDHARLIAAAAFAGKQQCARIVERGG
jgi:hypothetical protein